MSDASVRRARPDDVPAIVSIWSESMRLHGSRDPTFRPRADGHLHFERFVAERVGAEDAAVIVAEVEGRVAAYGVCILRSRPDYFEPGERGLVTDVDVSADFRRRGLGERVLAVLCDWVRDRGIDRIEAEVVSANDISAAFWRKQGFATYYEAMCRSLA